jgi:hypothetical protein
MPDVYVEVCFDRLDRNPYKSFIFNSILNRLPLKSVTIKEPNEIVCKKMRRIAA